MSIRVILCFACSPKIAKALCLLRFFITTGIGPSRYSSVLPQPTRKVSPFVVHQLAASVLHRILRSASRTFLTNAPLCDHALEQSVCCCLTDLQQFLHLSPRHGTMLAHGSNHSLLRAEATPLDFHAPQFPFAEAG